MLLHILGPNGCFLRSRCNPSSFGNEFKLFLYFPLPGLFWNAASKRCSLPSRQGALKKRENKGGEICARGPGVGNSELLVPGQPAALPHFHHTCWSKLPGKAQTFSWKQSSKHPRARRTSNSFSLILLHQTGPLHWFFTKLCTEVKELLGRGAEALLTSTGSSPRASLHQLTLSPCAIRRNKPFELRAWWGTQTGFSHPLISSARYPCAAHNRSNRIVQSCLIKGKPSPWALEKERNLRKCSLGSHYIFCATSENQNPIQIPVPSLTSSVTWIRLFNLSVP